MACTTASRNEFHLKSLERVQTYPIVNDSLTYALGCYKWIKSSNRILDNTLSIAETTLKTVKNTAEPLAAKPLGMIDNVVSNQLERLEKSYPIILSSSSSIANIPSKVYHENFESTVKTIMWPVTKTIDVVSNTKDIAVSTVSSVVSSSIQKVLPSNLIPSSTTNYILDKTDELLDKYLPEIDESNSETSTSSDVKSRVKHLSKKTQRRLQKKASEQIQVLIESSMVKLKQIQTIIEEILKKKEDYQLALLERYSHTVSSIREKIPSVSLKAPEFINDAIHYSENVQKLMYKTTNTTVAFMFNKSLNGLSLLNERLLKLEKVLKESKQEYINTEILVQAAKTINEIHVGLDSFIHNMRRYLRNKFQDKESSESTEMRYVTESSHDANNLSSEGDSYSDD